MNVQDKIRLEIVKYACSGCVEMPSITTKEELEEFIGECEEGIEYFEDYMSEGDNEVRCNYDCETNIRREYSRHYESMSVAKKMGDGSWVGWTYWYGGGKHGQPESIDWISDAYELDCKEEEKVVIVREFTKK